MCFIVLLLYSATEQWASLSGALDISIDWLTLWVKVSNRAHTRNTFNVVIALVRRKPKHVLTTSNQNSVGLPLWLPLMQNENLGDVLQCVHVMPRAILYFWLQWLADCLQRLRYCGCEETLQGVGGTYLAFSVVHCDSSRHVGARPFSAVSETETANQLCAVQRYPTRGSGCCAAQHLLAVSRSLRRQSVATAALDAAQLTTMTTQWRSPTEQNHKPGDLWFSSVGRRQCVVVVNNNNCIASQSDAPRHSTLATTSVQITIEKYNLQHSDCCFKKNLLDVLLFRLAFDCFWASLSVLAPMFFLPARRSKRGMCYGNVAGCVAGCLSHTGIVSKRLNLS